MHLGFEHQALRVYEQMALSALHLLATIVASIVRWGGWAGMMAAVLFLLAGALRLIAQTPRIVSFDSLSDYFTEVILVVAFALTLVAIAGLHALQSGRYGRLGATGSLITFVGYALIVVVAAVSTLVGGEALFAVRLTGALAVLLGRSAALMPRRGP